MKRKLKALVFCLVLLCSFGIFSYGARAEAAKPLDEITDYTITVDVRDDAKLNIKYHIEWLVLDSSSEGPVTWVKVGLPNKHIESSKKLSKSIKTLTLKKSGEVYARLDLDKSYYKGETIVMEFEIVQDYMYQVDKLKEGETVYEFTPGWFDEINVDSLTIRWNAEKVESSSPSSLMEDGYYVWTTSLKMGKKFSVSVTYPNTAYGFDLTKKIEKASEDDGVVFLAIFVVFVTGAVVFVVWIASLCASYSSTANFSGTPQTKITRTRVVYWPSCQGCGGARPEGEENCPYCGRSFIKSEELIKEEDFSKEEDGALLKKAEGLYPTASDPNTFIRVHVIHTPRPAARAHSSCVHSSCACACACACAGGGRAGCSAKDFYHTNLKLAEFAKRAGKKGSTPQGGGGKHSGGIVG